MNARSAALEYAILTAIISRATFGKLKKQNTLKRTH